jgi:signal transduction histidine kinase
MLFYLLVFISTLLVNRLALKNTWKPFYQLLEFLDDFRLDDKTVPDLTETRIKEFRLLNNSVLKLLRTNVDMYAKQKHFIENASHELQTPLAIGLNKLELLAGDGDLSGEQVSKIGEIIESLRRLSGLSKSLLLLSKIENRQFISKEKVNFDDLIGRILRDFSDFAAFKELNVSYQKEASWVHIMNSDLAEILVMNLVKNAIVHNTRGGILQIVLHANDFIIENDSEEASLEAAGLFRRFIKRSGNKQSTGLGLAIVKAIADESGLVITYSYTQRHVFTITAN